MPKRTLNVLIFGGTSGIGLALAHHHLALGWQVTVVGSRADKINALTTSYPPIRALQYDLAHRQNRQDLLTQLDHEAVSSSNFNRIFYCAGWYLNERMTTLTQADSEKMLAINLQAFHDVFAWASEHLKQNDGLKNTNDPLQPPIRPALICLASIAGVMDYPYASLYAKCKRAMITTASAYRLALSPFDIQVNCIASGYVDTQTLRDLNNGDTSHKPFVIDEQTAVHHIMQAIEDNTELAIFPKQMRYLTGVLNRLPKPLLNALMRQKLDKLP
ncbi:MAG: SDR family NAD(P)-dependent oxidoreductase [Psychrobacter sp.]|nr:SDR family NAD(P)-dependent oxidoreductase [Psychrobacter sp.]